MTKIGKVGLKIGIMDRDMVKEGTAEIFRVIHTENQ